MAVRPVLKMGHPLLRQVAAPVEVFDAAQMSELLTDMEETMRALMVPALRRPRSA